MSNILIAIKNLVEHPVVALTAHYSGRNRVNGIGNALEVYIKDLFANTLAYDEESKLYKYEEIFSYLGNQNNPPDIILKKGDAIEVKKVQSNAFRSSSVKFSFSSFCSILRRSRSWLVSSRSLAVLDCMVSMSSLALSL